MTVVTPYTDVYVMPFDTLIEYAVETPYTVEPGTYCVGPGPVPGLQKHQVSKDLFLDDAKRV